MKLTLTSELESEDGGTRLSWRMRLDSRLPRPIARQIAERAMQIRPYFEAVERHSVGARRA